ncbi:hypothetical protein MMC25_000502 [Agyrium rufum]|nr:hypothetical protein [Agyrium rufum]
MAEQLSGVMGGLQGTLQGTIGGVIGKGQSILDRFLPPERRSELAAKFSKFATEQPALASFLISQFALSGIPLLLFVVMTITVFVFALLVALLVGVLGALLFTVFMVGVALIILLPTLFITTFAASFVWLWGIAAYYILKWFNEKDIPGIHNSLGEGMQQDGAPLESLGALKDAGGDAKAEAEKGDLTEGKEEAEAKRNGQAPPPQKKKEEQNGGPGGIPMEKLKEVANSTGLSLDDVKKKADVGNIKQTAAGIKGAIPGGLVSV